MFGANDAAVGGARASTDQKIFADYHSSSGEESDGDKKRHGARRDAAGACKEASVEAVRGAWARGLFGESFKQQTRREPGSSAAALTSSVERHRVKGDAGSEKKTPPVSSRSRKNHPVVASPVVTKGGAGTGRRKETTVEVTVQKYLGSSENDRSAQEKPSESTWKGHNGSISNRKRKSAILLVASTNVTRSPIISTTGTKRQRHHCSLSQLLHSPRADVAADPNKTQKKNVKLSERPEEAEELVKCTVSPRAACLTSTPLRRSGKNSRSAKKRDSLSSHIS
jgi:hypothetical protein